MILKDPFNYELINISRIRPIITNNKDDKYNIRVSPKYNIYKGANY